MAETVNNPTAEQLGAGQPEQKQLTPEQKLVQAIDKTRALLAKRTNGNWNIDTDMPALVELVGDQAAKRLALGEPLGANGVQGADLQGEIGRLREEAKAEDVKAPEKEARASAGPMERLKNAVNGLFAENGVLNLKSWAQSANETRKDWWNWAKEKLGRGKTEAAADKGEALDDSETESAWQQLRNRGAEFRGEAGIRIRELLKGGKEKGKELAALLRDNADARDQVLALGFNITTNALKLNPVGIMVPAAVKYIVDTRAYNRAADAGEGQSFIEKKFQEGTNRDAYRRGGEVAPVNQEELAEFRRLDEEAKALYSAASAAEGLFKFKRGVEKRTKNEKRKGEYINDILPPLEKDYLEKKATFEAFKEQNAERYEELSQKYENTDDVTQEREAKAQTRFGKLMRAAARGARLVVDGIGVYSNIGKKALVDAQGAGNNVDDFIRNNVEEGDQKNEDAVINAFNALAERLNTTFMNGQLETAGGKKDLESDLKEFRDLLKSLIDLGLIGDMIPRNIGHKQINSFFTKIGLGGWAGREGLFRNPDFVAKLRNVVQEKAVAVANNLTHGTKLEGAGRGMRKAVNDIIEMGAADNAADYLLAREQHIALRLRSADILGMFANGVIVAEITRGAELRAAGQRIADSFNHESDLAGVEQQGLGGPVRPDQVGGPVRPNTTDLSARPTEVRPLAGSQTALREAGITNANDQLNLGNGRVEDYVNNNGTLRLNPDGTFRDGQASFIAQAGFDNPGELIAADLRNVSGVEPGTFSQILNATIDLSRSAGRTFTPEEMALITRGFNGEFGDEVAAALSMLGNSHTGQENIPMIFDALGING
jgi:hypothetical protein